MQTTMIKALSISLYVLLSFLALPWVASFSTLFLLIAGDLPTLSVGLNMLVSKFYLAVLFGIY